MYYIIWGFFSLMQPVPMAAALLQMLEFRNRRSFAPLYVLSITFFVWLRMFFLYHGIGLWRWCNVGSTLVIALLPVCMSKNRLGERVLSSVLMLFVALSGELGIGLLESIFRAILHRDSIFVDFMSPGYAAGVGIGFMITCIAAYFISRFWNHRLHPERIHSFMAILAVPPMLTEAFILIGWTISMGSDYSREIVSILASGVGISALLSLFFLLCVILEQARKERADRELEELLHQMDIERERYRSLEENREAVAKFRHDFNNQLASLKGMSLGGELQDAHVLHEQLRKKIQKLM